MIISDDMIDEDSQKNTSEKIDRNISFVDKISLPPNKPSIREIINVNLKVCNIKRKVIKTCNDTNLSIKGYKIIKINYEGLNCYGKIISASFINPLFELIPIHSFDTIQNVTTNICYSSSDLVSRRLIYIYNIFSVTAHIESSECYCDSNITPVYDSEPFYLDKNCYLEKNFYFDDNCNSNWHFKNDFL